MSAGGGPCARPDAAVSIIRKGLIMRQIGSILLILGAGSAVLFFLGYEFRILSWIDSWGETVGWGIRGVMIVVGGGLLLFDRFAGQGDAEESSEEQEA